MSRLIDKPSGGIQIPSVSETHSLTISGKQLDETGDGFIDVVQQKGTAEKLLKGELVTGGRNGAPISCGQNDTAVSRLAISASINQRRLTFNALTQNEVQVLVFEDGKNPGIKSIMKTDTGANERADILIGGKDTTVILAMGTPPIREESSLDSSELLERSIAAFGAKEGASLMSALSDQSEGQPSDIRAVLEEALNHSNFIRLDFTSKGKFPLADAIDIYGSPVTDLYDVSLGCKIHDKVDRVRTLVLEERLLDKLGNGGNLLFGRSEKGASAVDVQIGTRQDLSTRQAVFRLDECGECKYAVVENLAPENPLQVFQVDYQGNEVFVPFDGDIARVEIPLTKPVAVKIGFGTAPFLNVYKSPWQEPVGGAKGQSDRITPQDFADLGVETGKYRFRFDFTSKQA